MISEARRDRVSKEIGTSLKKEMDASFKKTRDEMIEVATNMIGNYLKVDVDRAFLKIKNELTEANVGLAMERIGERREEEVFTGLQNDNGEMKIKTGKYCGTHKK